jgi:hypothetical protein
MTAASRHEVTDEVNYPNCCERREVPFGGQHVEDAADARRCDSRSGRSSEY